LAVSLIESKLFDISPLNGLVPGDTAVLPASFLPSRCAARVPPIEALRMD
jgi:hypothetical protein